ncbi:hypothetical protein F5B19DRAFT_181945 [Rostrohypoxylon terebratum]|nr:hypothetical protein F5B19DRAFT_181945 [Rostrohypoxylon terebratum]
MNTLISIRNTPITAKSRILWIIVPVCSLIGVACAITLAFAGHAMLRRRRQAALREFEAARLRDPALTWDVYARRRRFTHSRLLFEQELLRSTIIRKSQQSRTSVVNNQKGGSDQLIDIKRAGGEDEILLEPHRRDDRFSEDVCVENTPTIATMQHMKVSEGRRYPTPTNVRLQTPPLLAHPALRDHDRPYPPRNSSLPIEVTQSKPFPSP